jgi:hypothetical protein
MRKNVASCLCVLLLVSCASLPLPDAPGDSLYLIPTDFEPGGKLTGILLEVTSPGEDGTEVVFSRHVAPGEPYAVYVLPPGRYLLKQALLGVGETDKQGNSITKWEKAWPLNQWFSLEENSVQISRRVLQLKTDSDPVFQASNEIIADVARKIRNDRNWLAWEGCALVNFPEPTEAAASQADAALPAPAATRTGAIRLAATGEPAYVEVAQGSSIASIGTQLTVEARVLLESTPGTNTMQWIVGPHIVDGISPFGIYVSSAGATTVLGDIHLEHQAWYHLALVYNGKAIKMYVNGELTGATEAHGPIRMRQGEPLYIGALPGNPNTSFEGRIADLRVWSVARTGDEIRASMNVELTGKEPGLWLYYRFDGDAMEMVEDRSGNGNHGVIHGEYQFVDDGL